jgi:O-antigen/teichoic acid export membrane protein
MLRAVALVCIPIGIGLSLVSDDLVLALLGSQWVGHAHLLPWLAGYATTTAMGSVLTGHILIVTGNERRALISTWIDISIAAPTIIVGGAIAGVDGVVRAMLLATLLSLPVKGYILGGALDVSLARLFACAARPILAGIAMALVMRFIPFDTIQQLHARLALQVLAGATIYAVAVISLWWLRGRPPGPERLALTLLAARIGIHGHKRKRDD